jgi:hypothetical protein
MSAQLEVGGILQTAARQAMRRSARYLTGLQQPDGHWCAELTADSTL